MKRPELLIFARHPVVGQVKVRLQSDVTPAGAAELASFLLRATVELATEYWPGDVYLYGLPDEQHPLFRELAVQRHVHLASQGAGDPGQRMAAALAAGIARRGAAAVMDCDIPHAGGQLLETAYETLARGHNVLGPTVGGGYYLVGLQNEAPALFAGIPWGGGAVLDQTLAQAQEAGIGLELLPRLRTVSTLADLAAIALEYPPLQAFLPASMAKRFVLVEKPQD
jgi:rSAM/selenodomain-associated transferase 1